LFLQGPKDDTYSNACNQVATTKQIDQTYFVSDEYDIGEKAVFRKIQALHTLLEERLNAEKLKIFDQLYGENSNTHNFYYELKNHALNFTMEQLSHDALLQYMMTIKHPGKWLGTLFKVVLHWHKQIKEYMWLELIGLLPMQTLRFRQSAVEDVVELEYMLQIDHKECVYWKVLLIACFGDCLR
jgi:hypothetical protein